MKQMNEELKIIISADTKDAVKNVKKTTDEVKDFEKQTEEAEKAADEAFKSIGETTKTAMASVTVAIAAGAAALVGLAESTKEYRVAQSKLNTAFEAAGQSAETANAVYSDLQSVLGDTDVAVEAANHLAKLGTTTEELADLTDICAGVYATFGDSLAIEGLTEAINHTSKLGEVQGTLADAFEWSGVNVDDFNEELKKCKTESERQKKIIEKLNGLYKNTGKLYKENNKDLIASNKANEKWNKTMAQMGKYTEPVITSLKEMGTALAEECEEPIEDVVDFVSKKVIPTITDTIRWIKENQATVVGVGAAVVATLVGVKVAMVQADLATKGLTISTVAQTAAQTALNAVMNLNPYTLALTALVALTAGIVAYYSTIDVAIPIVEVLTEEEKKLIDSALQAGEAFEKQKEAIEENASGVMAHTEHTTKLADELLALADASGKVNEEDEARAQFILNELNGAYGTEYTMVDGVIQKYDELKNSIYEVINAKTAQSLLELHNEAYVEAVDKETKTLRAVNAALKDKEAAETAYEEFKKKHSAELTNLHKTYELQVQSGNTLAGVETAKRIEELEKQEKALEDDKKKKKKTYDELVSDYVDYSNEIEVYTDAQTAALQGDYDKTIDILKGKSSTYGDYVDVVDKETQRALEILYDDVIKTGIKAKEKKKAFEDGVKGYTEEMVKEAESGHDAALKEWEKAYDEAYGIGGDMSDGLKEGLESDKLGLVSKAKTIIKSIWGAMRKEADSHSPSRKTMALGGDMGEGLEIGLDKSTDNVVKSAKNMVKEAIIPMQSSVEGVRVNNIGNALSSAMLGMNANSVSIKAQRETLYTEAGGKTTPIVLQVDGKVFAQTSINTINQLTKQTGKLQLVLG